MTDVFGEANGGYVFYDATDSTGDNGNLSRVTSANNCTVLETINAGEISHAHGANNTVIILQAIGSEIAVFTDNVAYFNVTDANITAAGKGGIGMGALPCDTFGDLSTSAQQIDNFSFKEIAGSTTGYAFPSTTGEISNAWTNPTNAYADDAAYAEEDDDGGAQDYGDFGFSVAAGSTIRGLQCAVELESGQAYWIELGLEVSIDNGSTWSSQLLVRNEPTTPNVYLMGHANYLWGLTWTVDDTADTDLRVRVEQNASQSITSGRDTEVDYIKCQVFSDAGGGEPPAAATSAQIIFFDTDF